MSVRHLFFAAKLKYDGKKEIGLNTYTFNFNTVKPIKWTAGQHALLELKTPEGRRTVRPFSIASAPGESVITVATKISPDKPDAFKQLLFKLKRGDIASLRGPIGRAVIKNHRKNYAMLTTGIGINPFRSILKQLVLDGQLDTKITLFFVGNKDSHYFKDEINSLKNVLRNLKVEYIYKPDRITGQILEEKLGKELFDTIYFISGSPTLVRNYKRTLLGLGIKPRNIRSNNFWELSRKPAKVTDEKPASKQV